MAFPLVDHALKIFHSVKFRYVFELIEPLVTLVTGHIVSPGCAMNVSYRQSAERYRNAITCGYCEMDPHGRGPITRLGSTVQPL
jgi:hypothetical protein